MLPSSAAAAAYYDDVGDDLQEYGQQAFGGRGVGSLAIWAARRFSCRVTGITICEDHVGRSQAMAREYGLQDQCRFLFMDMDRLEFGDQTFDAVFNQESFCYSSDKRLYLASVHRVLRPGGTWRAVAFSVQPGPLSPRQAEEYDAVRDGFKLASMLPAVEIEFLMNLAGFVGTRAIDITSAVLTTARTMIRTCGVPLWLMRLQLDWLICSREARRRDHHQGHYRAGKAYSTGLLKGYFRHFLYSGCRA
jgi:SAM-dependent methyltransferase